MYSWGENGYGQLGLGDTDSRKIPTLVSGIPKGTIVTDISAHSHHVAVTVQGGEEAVVGKSLKKKTVELASGIYLLNNPEEPCLDIVLIGSSLRTWTSPDGSLWPRDWLSTDFPVPISDFLFFFSLFMIFLFFLVLCSNF